MRECRVPRNGVRSSTFVIMQRNDVRRTYATPCAGGSRALAVPSVGSSGCDSAEAREPLGQARVAEYTALDSARMTPNLRGVKSLSFQMQKRPRVAINQRL